jgi:hypothetical protein
MKLFHVLVFFFLLDFSNVFCKKDNTRHVQKWQEAEFTFTSVKSYENPYTNVSFHAHFVSHDDKIKITRPGFYDGNGVWKIRFAAPHAGKKWKLSTFCSDTTNSMLHGQTRIFKSTGYKGTNKLTKHGLLKMHSNNRQVIHSDGTPFFIIGDTPWALPFRARYESALIYAKDRQEKGFNTALLMTVQPDMNARGSSVRGDTLAFARGFFDLSEGHLNEINTDYFKYLDSLISILISHEIVPVYQPVFQGFGWRGMQVLGRDVDPEEYSRYCKYLIARYGARPAIWLVSGDNTGLDPCVEPAGKTVQKWDSYAQPAGIHYNPFDDYCPENQPEWKCFHYNKSHQSAEWLDFQWAQTGHNGVHNTDKVAEMYENRPVKGVANGEPTYEGMGGGKNGLGWWQGREAWLQIMHGATMGHVYGAASLWQWKYFADEPGWTEWASAPISWRTALELKGSIYVGYLAKVFEQVDFIGMRKHPEIAGGHPLLAKMDEFYITYIENGKEITINKLNPDLSYQWFDPLKGLYNDAKNLESDQQTFIPPSEEPWVLIIK